MEITSIGFLSETLFQYYSGSVRNHGDCIEVRTPDNYSFWFGNYLLLGRPPEVANISQWITRFEVAFSDVEEVRHKCLQWPDDGSETKEMRAEFERFGWEFDQTSVLCATESKSVRTAPKGLVMREISGKEDWDKVLAHHVLTRPEGFAEAAYRAFKVNRLALFQELIFKGHGQWYAAFKGAELVADMGIFNRNGISRFQEVSTHPKHRRQGICAALVHYVSCTEQEARPGNRMVILADHGEPAERIYKSLGYVEVEQVQSVVLRPKGWDG